MVDQNAFLYHLFVWASLCIPAVCPYVYLVHHVVFNYPIFHLYHWIRMSFKCPSGKCCHLTILPRTKNVKMYFKSGNSKLYQNVICFKLKFARSDLKILQYTRYFFALLVVVKHSFTCFLSPSANTTPECAIIIQIPLISNQKSRMLPSVLQQCKKVNWVTSTRMQFKSFLQSWIMDLCDRQYIVL